MPPSARKGKTRARRAPATEVHDPSDAETPEAIATPSRSSRKRNLEPGPVAPRNTRRKVKDTRTLDRDDADDTEAQDQSEADMDPASPNEAEIIAHLKVADRHVNATQDFANDLLEGQEHVPGYGKIAGRDWAFIIRKVEVNLGRPEAYERLVVETNGESGPPPSAPIENGPSATFKIDIDLGPDRQVSRLHATIAYDSDKSQWFIIVNGRNGLRVDGRLLKRSNRMYLRNGSVIEIANTQMAFITTATKEGEVPIWDESIIRQTQKSSEDDDEGEDDTRANRQFPPGYTVPWSQLLGAQVEASGYDGQQRRPHPHSNQAVQGVPGTPMRGHQSYTKSSPAANYARGVMMESTETIDYSADGAKDLKPPHSYAQLIGMAILSTQDQQMTLANIYQFIQRNYAFYRSNSGGWQNSIRHNLSLNKAFTKIARRTDEPGKGMKWMIEPTEFDNFVQQGMKGCRRPNPMPGTQSTLGSPSSPMHRMRAGVNGVKRDEEITPPLNAYRPAYPTAVDAYTPDRGSRRLGNGVGLGINGDGPEYDYPTRSTPRTRPTGMANAAGSPPAFFVNDESRVGTLETPFPMRPTQHLAPPSQLRPPSDFIQFSSPAPFWKMDGLVGSTPWKPYDLSPLKMPFSTLKKTGAEIKKAGEEDGDDAGDGEGDGAVDGSPQQGEPTSKSSPIIHSSSPPRQRSSSNALEASPTLSRPATAGTNKTLDLLVAASQEAAAKEPGLVVNGHGSEEEPRDASIISPTVPQQASAPPANGQDASNSNGNGYVAPAPSNHTNSYTYTASQVNGFHEDGEDKGIDLAKGFQPIGAFHQRNHLAMSMVMTPAQASAYGR